MSLITSFTRTSQGGPKPALYTVPNIFDGNLAGRTMTANSGYFGQLAIPSPQLISAVKVRVVTASGNIKLGVFRWDGTTMTPIEVSSAIPSSSNNAVETFTLASPYLAPAGYRTYLGIAVDNGTISVNGASGVSSALVMGSEYMSKASVYSTFGQAMTSLVAIVSPTLYLAAV